MSRQYYPTYARALSARSLWYIRVANAGISCTIGIKLCQHGWYLDTSAPLGWQYA
jgi:hypothetical protein